MTSLRPRLLSARRITPRRLHSTRMTSLTATSYRSKFVSPLPVVNVLPLTVPDSLSTYRSMNPPEPDDRLSADLGNISLSRDSSSGKTWSPARGIVFHAEPRTQYDHEDQDQAISGSVGSPERPISSTCSASKLPSSDISIIRQACIVRPPSKFATVSHPLRGTYASPALRAAPKHRGIHKTADSQPSHADEDISSSGFICVASSSTQQNEPCPSPFALSSNGDADFSNPSTSHTQPWDQEEFGGLAASPYKLDHNLKSSTVLSLKEKGSDNPDSCWRYDMYKDVEGRRIPLHHCRKKDQSEFAAKLFFSERLIGLDLEWLSGRRGQTISSRSIKDNVSVIQVASARRVAVFHLTLHDGETAEQLLAPSLKQLLEDPRIVKTGVAILGDCTRLRTNLGVNVTSISELSHLYKTVKYYEGELDRIDKTLVSLSRQCEDVLGLPLYKDKDVRMCSWNRDLERKYLDYAATDAYVAIHIFAELNRRRMKLIPRPPLPRFAEEKLPILIAQRNDVNRVDQRLRNAEKEAASEDEDVESSIEASSDSAQESFLDRDEQSDADETSSSEQEDDPDEDSLSEAFVSDSNSTHDEQSSASVKSDQMSDAGAPESSSGVNQAPPEISLTEQSTRWAESYRSTHIFPSTSQRARAGMSQLRAYALWAEHRLDVRNIAALLRQPKPLEETTVAAYVLDSVLLERLPYDKDRLRQTLQILEIRASRMVYRRYQPLIKALEDE